MCIYNWLTFGVTLIQDGHHIPPRTLGFWLLAAACRARWCCFFLSFIHTVVLNKKKSHMALFGSANKPGRGGACECVGVWLNTGNGVLKQQQPSWCFHHMVWVIAVANLHWTWNGDRERTGRQAGPKLEHRICGVGPYGRLVPKMSVSEHTIYLRYDVPMCACMVM